MNSFASRVLLAWFTSEEFLVEGQPNLPSIGMAFAFMAALIVYAAGYYETSPEHARAADPHGQARRS